MTVVLLALLVSMAAGFAVSAATNASLITFRTGSMAPTMPTGTLAVTTPIRAEDVRPGDVITVRRSQESPPVTHRVVEVRVPQELGEHPQGTVELVLKGDDNDVPDSRPYFLTDARKIIVAVPRVGTWLMLAKSPVGSGVLILMTGALATWAFWPRGRE